MVISSQRIRKIRRERDLSGTEIARKLGISAQYYYSIERGQRNLSADLAVSLAEIFNVSVDYLLGRDDNPEVPSSDKTKNANAETKDNDQKASENIYDYTKDQSIPPAVKDLLDKLSAYPPEEQERIIKQINALFELLLKEENRSN